MEALDSILIWLNTNVSDICFMHVFVRENLTWASRFYKTLESLPPNSSYEAARKIRVIYRLAWYVSCEHLISLI